MPHALPRYASALDRDDHHPAANHIGDDQMVLEAIAVAKFAGEPA